MSSTHPNPQMPHATWTQFQSEVQVAIRSCLPTNDHIYDGVYVLLMPWENTPDFDDEIRALNDILVNIYHYTTRLSKIPCSERATHHVTSEVGSIMTRLQANRLFILHYAGHSTRHAYGGDLYLVLSPYPILYHPRGAMYQAQAWHPIGVDMSLIYNRCYSALARDPPDILHLLDCCYAGAAAVESRCLTLTERCESLAACGMTNVADGLGTPTSFTTNLIETLTKANGVPFTIAQLHSQFVRRYYQTGRLARVPFHDEISDKMRARGSIMLSPLRSGTTSVPHHMKGYRAFIQATVKPNALITVTLSDKANEMPIAKQWARWLTSQMPPGIGDVNFSIPHLYHSKSWIVMMKLPVEVWATLKGHPCCKFIGSVTSNDPMGTEGKKGEESEHRNVH